MAPPPSPVQPTLHAPGLGTEAVTAAILDQLSDQTGLTVRVIEHGRIAVTRTRRPRWAVALGVLTIWIGGLGLLFLLIRRTDTGHITVNEGPRGARVALPANLDGASVNLLRSGLGPDAPTAPEPAPFSPMADLDASTAPR